MFIKGDQIALRAMEPGDADTLYNWENDRQLWAHSLTQTPFSHFVLEEFVNASHQDIYTNRQLRLMVVDLESEESAGTLDLFDFDPQHNRAGIGIFISESFRKKGLAAECLRLALDYAFRTLLLRQVWADVNENNTASLGLFQKAGFDKCGLKQAWHRTGLNNYENVWLLQCLNKD